MRRRTYLKTTGGIAAAATLCGCTGSSNRGEGYLTTEMRAGSSGDIDDFETLTLLITKKHLMPVDAERKTIDVHETEINLVQLQGDWAKPIGSTQDRGTGGIREPLDAGEYESLQLEVKEIIEAKLSDGTQTNVTMPEESVLAFDTTFEIRDEMYATFVAVASPVEAGQADQYVLKPMIDEVEISYKEG